VKPPNAADTKKHEKEKHRLKEIDTCKSAQGGIEKFFTKPG
jgi:endonuclease YncB( thermonuclease family)